MDAPRTWQALSVATAAVALGVGAAIVRAPASLPAPPIELSVVEPLDRAPVPSPDDALTSPAITGADPRIVLPQLRQGGTPARVDTVQTAASTATPDDVATSTTPSRRTTSGPTGASTGGDTPADELASADSSASVASPSSADSD